MESLSGKGLPLSCIESVQNRRFGSGLKQLLARLTGAVLT